MLLYSYRSIQQSDYCSATVFTQHRLAWAAQTEATKPTLLNFGTVFGQPQPQLAVNFFLPQSGKDASSCCIMQHIITLIVFLCVVSFL